MQTTNVDRRTARVVGGLFLLATIAFAAGDWLLAALASAPDPRGAAAAHPARLVLGALLEFADAVAVVAIAVLLFPILKRVDEPIALGYVGFRVLEAALLIASLIGPLMLIRLGQGAGLAAADGARAGGLRDLLIAGQQIAYQLAMIALGIGSVGFCAVLARARLVPRPIAAGALLGYLSLIVGAILELGGVRAGVALSIPGAIGEIVLPVWLIAKGFDATALGANPAP